MNLGKGSWELPPEASRSETRVTETGVSGQTLVLAVGTEATGRLVGMSI